MPDIKIVLRGAAAEKLRKLVSEDRYERPEDAVSDALDALEASRDPSLDAWLRDVVVARAEPLANDPSRGRTAEQVRAQLRGQSGK